MAARSLPPVRSIVAFDAFARCGTVSAAARELGVSTATVSRYLETLETWMKKPLFIQDGRVLVMTEDAQQLASRLSGSLFQIEEALAQVQTGHTDDMHKKRTVRVMTSGALALNWLTERVITLATLWPNVEIEVMTGVSDAAWYNFDFDIALVNTMRVPNTLGKEYICPDEVTLVVSKRRSADLRLATNEAPSASWFKATPIITSSVNRYSLDDWLSDNSAFERMEMSIVEKPILLQMINALSQGQGAAVGSRLLFQSGLRNGVLIEPWPKLRVAGHGWWVCTKSGSADDFWVRRVADYLKREVTESLK